MYEHLGDYESAKRVAKLYMKQNYSGILVNQARSHIEKREYKKAEICFIEAKKPELAIKMYMDLQNFQDATRVAKKEAPHLLPDLANQSRAGAGANLSGEELIQNAKVAEDCRDYNKAIELYLSVTPDNIEDLDTIVNHPRKLTLAITTSHSLPSVARLETSCATLTSTCERTSARSSQDRREGPSRHQSHS